MEIATGVRRLLRGVLWAMLWAIAGPIVGVSFGWGLDQPLVWSGMVGAGLAAGLGFIYGLLLPDKRREQSRVLPKARFGPETCAWCTGQGVAGKAQKACPACDGQGKVLVEQPGQRCSYCRGKGRTLLGRRCSLCDGAGWATYVMIFKPKEKQKVGRSKAV